MGKMCRQEAADACGATQSGVSTPGACVKLRHDLLLDWTLAPEKALVGVDLSNLHNSVRTARLESQVIHRVPRMAELMGWARSARTHVYKDEHGALHQVSPVDGLDQGCPASNALAPISIAEAHEDLQAFGSVYGLQDDTYLHPCGQASGCITVRFLATDLCTRRPRGEPFKVLRSLSWAMQHRSEWHSCDQRFTKGLEVAITNAKFGWLACF